MLSLLKINAVDSERTFLFLLSFLKGSACPLILKNNTLLSLVQLSYLIITKTPMMHLLNCLHLYCWPTLFEGYVDCGSKSQKIECTISPEEQCKVIVNNDVK